MARTIGKRNIEKVRSITHRAWKEHNTRTLDGAIARLPANLWNLWDIWEGSHQEIVNIIEEEQADLAQEEKLPF